MCFEGWTSEDTNTSTNLNTADATSSFDWRTIDRTLRGLARRRGALDAEEARWLCAAYRVRIWREVGCVHMVDYMERFLGYGARNAQERLKVALALEALPRVAAALGAGTLPFTAARTLLRVVTPANEQQWLARCAGKSVHQIEEDVSGRQKGDLPDDLKQPDLELRTVRYNDVRPSTAALEREALAKARAVHGALLEDDQFLAMLYRSYLERVDAGEASATEEVIGRAAYQLAVLVCEQCQQGWRVSGGKQFALDAAELERARCDAQHIGSLDVAQPARASQDVPPRIRRLVWRRDRGRCAIDGCRSTANLEVHHILAREHGGSHDPWNLVLACDACHAAIHRGLITVSGKAPDALVVTRKHAPGAHVCAPTSFDRVTIDIDAKAALVQAGFSKSEVAAAVAAVRAEMRGELALETVLREALKRCRRG